MFLEELMPYGDIARGDTAKNRSRNERRLVEQPFDGRGSVLYGRLFCDAGGLQRWRVDLLQDEEAKAFRGEGVENARDEETVDRYGGDGIRNTEYKPQLRRRCRT